MGKHSSKQTVLLVILVALVAYLIYCKCMSGKPSGAAAGGNLSGRTADGGTGHSEAFSGGRGHAQYGGGFDPQDIAAMQAGANPGPFGGSPQPGLAGFRQAMNTQQRRVQGKALDASLAGSGEVYGTTGDNYYGGNNTYDQQDYGAHVSGDWGSQVVDQVAGPNGSRMRQNHSRWANEMAMWSSPSMIVDHLDVFDYQPKTGAAGFVRFRPTAQVNPSQIQTHIDPHDFTNNGDKRRFYF